MGSIRRAAWCGRRRSPMPPCCRRRGLRRHLTPRLFVPSCSPGGCRFRRRPRAQHGARNMLVLCAQGRRSRSGGARGWLMLLVLRGSSHRRFAEHGERNSPSGQKGPAATAAAAFATVGVSSSLFMKAGSARVAATERQAGAGRVQQQQEQSRPGYSTSPHARLRPFLSWQAACRMRTRAANEQSARYPHVRDMNTPLLQTLRTKLFPVFPRNAVSGEPRFSHLAPTQISSRGPLMPRAPPDLQPRLQGKRGESERGGVWGVAMEAPKEQLTPLYQVCGEVGCTACKPIWTTPRAGCRSCGERL